MKNREFYIVLDKGSNLENFAECTAFINPSVGDFRYWKEHENIWEVIKVHEIETDLKPVEKDKK